MLAVHNLKLYVLRLELESTCPLAGVPNAAATTSLNFADETARYRMHSWAFCRHERNLPIISTLPPSKELLYFLA